MITRELYDMYNTICIDRNDGGENNPLLPVAYHPSRASRAIRYPHRAAEILPEPLPDIIKPLLASVSPSTNYVILIGVICSFGPSNGSPVRLC